MDLTILIASDFSILLFLLFYFAFMYVCVPYACSTFKGQKRVLDPLELDLETVGSLHVGVLGE